MLVCATAVRLQNSVFTTTDKQLADHILICMRQETDGHLFDLP